MLDKIEGAKWAGTFIISPGNEVYGELTLSGPKTSLHLHDNEHFDTHTISDQCVKGILHDLRKVSLIQCITTSGPGSGSRGNGRYYFANIFPHFVVYGDHHISPSEKTISEIHFVVDDASTLFYDFDAFSSLLDAHPFIEQIVQSQANALDRKITTGTDPQILYFTGKREIFATDTVLGKVSASHNPNHSMGGPNGVRLDNTILVTLAFNEAVTFDDAISDMCALLRYLEMLVGRPQNLLRLSLRVRVNEKNPIFLQVYWSMPPKREPSHEDQNPHPADVLVDAITHTESFSRVLKNWFDRQHAWHDARLRFSRSFAQQQRYSIDRLIGAANMFDILPSSAAPPEVELSEELKAAKEDCRKIFKKLPLSLERESVLRALGRVGKSVLKHKIRHRSQRLLDVLGDQFPELVTVIDEAVNCRNYYVHGNEPRFDYNNNFGTIVFFTNTLEFVFATSDLIDAGWDAKAWSEIGTTMFHPFAAYRVTYAAHLNELKALLSQPGTK